MNRSLVYFLILTVCGSLAFFYIDAKARGVSDEIEKMSVRANYLSPKKLTKTVSLEYPKAGQKILSPLHIRGSVSGRWYFEGVISVEVYDDNHKVIGRGPLNAMGDWMTEKKVPFEGVVRFDLPLSTQGYIKIQADNPSGEGAVSSFELPVTFDLDEHLLCGDMWCPGQEVITE